MTEKGWIACYREDFYDPAWPSGSPTAREAWIDMVMMANWSPGEVSIGGRRVTLKRGQLAWSVAYMAKRWGWSPGKVKRHLEFLEATQRIDRLPSHVTSVITITNYERDQFGGSTDGPTTRTGQLTGQPTGQLTDQLTSEPTDQLHSGETPDNSGPKTCGDGSDGSTDGPTRGLRGRNSRGPSDGPQTEEVTINNQPSPPTPQGERGGWEELIEELEGLGVRQARTAATAAQAAGCEPDDFRPSLAHWRANRELWASPEGVLCRRLEYLRPGQPAAEGWPTYDSQKERERRRRDEQRDGAQRRKLAVARLASLAGSEDYDDLVKRAHRRIRRDDRDANDPRVVELYMLDYLANHPDFGKPLGGQYAPSRTPDRFTNRQQAREVAGAKAQGGFPL